MTICSICGQPVDQPSRGYRLSHNGSCKRTRDALNGVSRLVKIIASGQHDLQVTPEARAALRGEIESLAAMLA